LLRENDNDNVAAISSNSNLAAEKGGTLRNDNSKKHRIDITDVANVALFLAVFVGLWQLVTLLEIWPKTLLPTPTQVATSISELITSNSLIIGIATTLWRLVAGFAISVAVGGVVGLAMVKFQGFGKTMSSFAVGLLTFPSIAWIPFSILLIGFNDFGILHPYFQ
jgi:NitT/TauT family transport system permease protein